MIRNIKELNKRGINHEEDEIHFFLISDLLELNHTEEDKAKKELYKDKIKSWKNDINEHRYVILLQDAYFRLSNLTLETLKSKEFKDTLDENSIFPEQSISNIRKLNRFVTDLFKKEYSDFLDRTTINFKLNYSEITGFLAVITPLIFVGSYLNTRIYYLLFGISTTDYFTITDYLSTSIAASEMVIYSFLFAVIGIVLRVTGDFSATSSEQKSVNSKIHKWMRYIVYISILSIIWIDYYRNETIDYNSIGLVLAIIIFGSLSKISNRYFANPLKTLFLIFFSSFFLIFMICQAFSDAQSVKYNMNDSINLHIENNLLTKIPNEYVVLGSNSNYFFISDTAFVNIQVINKDRIDMVEIVRD